MLQALPVRQVHQEERKRQAGRDGLPCVQIGQYAPKGANKCTPNCPEGYGGEVTVPINLNLLLMLDKTGSIVGEWKNEIDTAQLTVSLSTRMVDTFSVICSAFRALICFCQVARSPRPCCSLATFFLLNDFHSPPHGPHPANHVAVAFSFEPNSTQQ